MFLPKPTGPYRVGLTTFVHAVEPARKFGVARLKDGSHLLEMDAVVFNVYYPADVSAKDSPRGTQWVDQPLSASVTGVAKFTGISPWAIWPVTWLYSSRLKIPVYEDALPLKAKDNRWRLAIFSHGLAGSKTMYSQFCSNLASQGYVVLAMEHRDRSGMLFMTRDGQPRYYAGKDDIDWGESTPKQFALYVEQLEFRRSEIYTAYSIFSDIVQGNPHSVHKLDGGEIDAAPWKDLAHVNERVVLAGHSFGGCTVLSILSSPPPDGHSDIPFSHALALDPWFEPLAIPGPMPPSYRESIPLCILNSQGFTLWKAHFPVVEQLAEKWPARSALFTLINCKHETFSDVYCLVPFAGRKFGKIFATILSLSHAFVEDRLDDEVKRQSIVPMMVEEHVEKGKTTRTLKGEPGQIIVHKQ